MLSRLFTYRPGWLAAALGLWTASFCVPIVTGLVSQQIFNRLQGNHSNHVLIWWLFAALAALAITEPSLGLLWHWTHTTFEAHIEALVRTNLFDWIIDRYGRRGSSRSPVTLMGNLRDDVPGHTGLVNEWYRLSGEGAFVVVALIIMLRIDITITALTFLPLAGVVIFTHWLRSRLPRVRGAAREATIAVTDYIGEIFAGVQTIKTSGAEDAVTQHLRSLSERRRRAQMHAQTVASRIDAVSQTTIIAGRGIVLLVGAEAMLAGRFSVGDFVLFTTYLEWMLELPRRLGRLLSQQQTSKKSLERLRDVLVDTDRLAVHRPVHLTDRIPRKHQAPATRRELRTFAVQNLSYNYSDGTRGIIEVSLTMHKGTVTVLTGEVAAGKTTLLEVLLGLRTAQSGSIAWNGEIIDDPATFMTPPHVAYKPQIPRLFIGTLRDAVLLGQHAYNLDIALHRAAFTSDLELLADGLETRIGSRGVRLSGGQLQRIAAARAYVREPELYVIDDIASALDSETQLEIWRDIVACREQTGGTFLIVSHHSYAIEHADQVLRLDHGRLS